MLNAFLFLPTGQTRGGDAGLQGPGRPPEDQGHLQHRPARHAVLLALRQLPV